MCSVQAGGRWVLGGGEGDIGLLLSLSISFPLPSPPSLLPPSLLPFPPLPPKTKSREISTDTTVEGDLELLLLLSSARFIGKCHQAWIILCGTRDQI